MGLVFLANQGLIKNVPEGTISYDKVLAAPLAATTEMKLGTLDSDEIKALLHKLDALAMSSQNEAIAKMVAEEVESIMVAVAVVKEKVQAKFRGLLASGNELDITWLRPKHVGGAMLNAGLTALRGLWGGASAGVYVWLNPTVSNVADFILDSQRMYEYAALIHLGAIDPVEVPKIEAVNFVLANIATPAQSTPFNLRRGFNDQSLPLVRWEKPVLVGPDQTGAIECYPNITGDTKFQLLSFVVGRAQDLTL